MFAGRKKAKAKEVPAWKLQLEAAEAVAPVAQEECDAPAAASSSGGTRDDGNSVDSIGAKRRRDDAVLRSESVEEEASRRDERDCGGVDRPCSQSPPSPSPSSPPSSQSPSPCPSATSARERSPDSETRVSAAESGADGASGAGFIAASSFDGARTGRVFRLGPQGLGYATPSYFSTTLLVVFLDHPPGSISRPPSYFSTTSRARLFSRHFLQHVTVPIPPHT